MRKNFNIWLGEMKETIATWNYYVDFKKVYKNLEEVKVELNILNSLINEKNIEEKFKAIVTKYPDALKVIPILLAVRDSEIKVQDGKRLYDFDFIKMNYSVDQYALFMRNSGLFEMLQNHVINNLYDYALGIEVGLDSNGRKNRGGHLMEDLVESYLIKAGLVKGETYYKEMKLSEIEKEYKLDLSTLSNNGKTEKRFDYVFIGPCKEVYAVECNFYASSGSKLNETARSYKTLALESKGIKNFYFVWCTDGKGWIDARNNLEETYEAMDYIFNINDLENGAIENLVHLEKFVKKHIN